MSRIPKILFTGTFETGKSTLLNLFADDPRVLIIPETPRDLLKDNPALEVDPRFQDMIFEEQMKRELAAEEKAQKEGRRAILCDRGIVDIIAYSQVFDYELQDLWVEAAQERYDLGIIFSATDIPNYTNIPELGLDMKEYRTNIEVRVRTVLKDFGIPCVDLFGSIPQRKETVSLLIDEKIAFIEGSKNFLERRG